MKETRPKDIVLQELLQNDPGFAEVYRCLPETLQNSLLQQPAVKNAVDHLINDYFEEK